MFTVKSFDDSNDTGLKHMELRGYGRPYGPYS